MKRGTYIKTTAKNVPESTKSIFFRISQTKVYMKSKQDDETLRNDKIPMLVHMSMNQRSRNKNLEYNVFPCHKIQNTKY